MKWGKAGKMGEKPPLQWLSKAVQRNFPAKFRELSYVRPCFNEKLDCSARPKV